MRKGDLSLKELRVNFFIDNRHLTIPEAISNMHNLVKPYQDVRLLPEYSVRYNNTKLLLKNNWLLMKSSNQLQ